MNPSNKKILDIANRAIFPLKIIVPQPIVAKIPWLTTNEEIRVNAVLSEVKGKLLDIGCGNNKLAKRYRDDGGEGIGVDVYPWEGVDLVVENTAKLPFPNGNYNSVTFLACFNHIPNRLEVLAEASRLLADDGQIILTNLTPTISKIWHKLAYWDKDQHERGMAEGEVWGFTRKEIVSLFSMHKFKLIKEKTFSWGLNRVFVFKK